MGDDQLTVEVVDRGPDILISVSGEMDFGTNADFLRVVQPLAESGRPLVVDLADLAFCDSSGLGALVRVHNMTEAAGGTLYLAHLRPQLKSTITLTMLHRLFHIQDDLPDPGAAPN
ncbi:STAS domain-containing protein [Kribbella sp. NPDC026596]|uniref:STAS domain-containing protein n=1 Tax=Kribbella sp. NPDC026596 TaxID=3155122 RepID=UPI0033D4A5DA